MKISTLQKSEYIYVVNETKRSLRRWASSYERIGNCLKRWVPCSGCTKVIRACSQNHSLAFMLGALLAVEYLANFSRIT